MSLIKLSLLIILEKLFKLFALRHSIGKKNPQNWTSISVEFENFGFSSVSSVGRKTF